MSILKVNSCSIDQESGEIWTVQTDLQQIYPKTDRLLEGDDRRNSHVNHDSQQLDQGETFAVSQFSQHALSPFAWFVAQGEKWRRSAGKGNKGKKGNGA